ncbi:nectin-1 isoform X7 [Arapaima gigas]
MWCSGTLLAEKPLPQGAPGGVFSILGGVVAAGLIIGVAVTVFMVYRRQQKTRTETDNDLTDLPPTHKPAPPPPQKKISDSKTHLTSDDIQVVHLDKEEEMQKLPLQPPYYDMAPAEVAHPGNVPPLISENVHKCHLLHGRRKKIAFPHFLSIVQPTRLWSSSISSLSSHLSCLQNSGHKDFDVQYAELDTSALASSPIPRGPMQPPGGDLVEYATIQPSSH